jgi:hypothetical protein
VDLDLLGFGLRSDEPKEMVIGVTGIAQPSEARITWIADWKAALFLTEFPGFVPISPSSSLY